MGQHHLVAVDHGLVAVVLGVGGGERRLMGRGVGGMGVVLGLIPRRRQGHGQTGAGVTLAAVGMAWMTAGKKKTQKTCCFFICVKCT